MNLSAIANAAITVINPNVTGNLVRNSDQLINPDGTVTPIVSREAVIAQVQAASSSDLRQVDSLNIAGVQRVAYVNRRIDGLNRFGKKGGDFLELNTGINSALDAWHVVAVLEPWGGRWTKIFLLLQESAPS